MHRYKYRRIKRTKTEGTKFHKTDKTIKENPSMNMRDENEGGG
jgi:hypothetical protein